MQSRRPVDFRTNEESWNNRLAELKEYKEANGNCDVPCLYDLNQPLARWVSRQRSQYKLYCENEASSLTPERIAALDEIGFRWEVVWVRRNNEP